MIEAGAVIIGIVNGVRLASDKITPFIGFLVALVLGILFGALGYFGLNVQTGIVAGLGSSGVYQVAKKLGGR